MAVVVTNNTGADYRLPDRRVIPDGESVVLTDEELQWIPVSKRENAELAVTALASPVSVTTEYLVTRLDEVGSGISYVGKAEPGSATDAAVWQITKVTEASGDVVIEYADGDANFNNIWDDRLSLSYE